MTRCQVPTAPCRREESGSREYPLSLSSGGPPGPGTQFLHGPRTCENPKARTTTNTATMGPNLSVRDLDAKYRGTRQALQGD